MVKYTIEITVDDDTISRVNDVNSTYLSIYLGHININRLSIPSHFSLLQAQCQQEHFDVIAISEKFATLTDPAQHLQIQGFNLHRHDR